jgi:hypothetical protein
MLNPLEGAGANWKSAMDATGATQMRHLRALIESRAFLTRIPDQSVISSGAGSGIHHVRATRDSGGSYALVYIPTGGAVTVNMGKVGGGTVDASWFNPRSGAVTAIGSYPNTGTRSFDAPGSIAEGNDWVLALDGKAAPPPAPPANPVAYWKLDEGSGTKTTDASGNSNTATLVNGASWATGKRGGAARLDGANDHLQAPASSTINSVKTRLTIAAWVYRNATQAGWTTVANRQKGTTKGEYYFLGFRDDRPSFYIDTASGEKGITASSAAPVASWFHVAATYDGTSMRLYVDGGQVASAPCSGVALTTDSRPITLGASHNDGLGTIKEALSGRLDNVRIYARALSAAEIDALVSGSN